MLKGGQDREATDELWDHPEGEKILRFYRLKNFQLIHGSIACAVLGMESQRLPGGAPLDDLIKADKGTAANEEDVLGIELDVLLMGMLAPALGWHVAGGGLQDFEKGLLDAFTRNVTGDGNVVRLAADLVDFINVDDADLGFLHVVVGILK